MPYVRFARRKYGERNVQVGSVTLWPDAEDTWRQLGVDRPRWFNIYREYPRSGSEQIGEPCHGTVGVAADEAWLALHHKRFVATLYFLGDAACLDGNSRTGRPGECFYARMLSLGRESHGLLKIWTKQGPLTEDDDSLKLTPPLAVRGYGDAYFLDLGRPEHAALVQLLFANPEHRLVTACLHYYLAQAGDPVLVSFEQDYANYCACLEAAFGIVQSDPDPAATAPVPPAAVAVPHTAGGHLTASNHVSTATPSASPSSIPTAPCPSSPSKQSSGTEETLTPASDATPSHPVTAGSPQAAATPAAPLPTKVFDQLVGKLVTAYGDCDEIRYYARGLYTCRSIYDHGLSDFDSAEVQKRRHQAYLGFLERRGNYSICRAICRDIILRQLWEQPGGARTELQKLWGYTDGASKLLRKFFYSERVWHAFRKRTKEQNAGRKIGNLTGDDFEAFRMDAVALLEDLEWEMIPAVDPGDVREVLKTMLIANANSTKTVPARSDAPSMHALGTAYDHKPGSEREIGIWAAPYEQHKFDLHGGDRTELIIAAAWKAASYFR